MVAFGTKGVSVAVGIGVSVGVRVGGGVAVAGTGVAVGGTGVGSVTAGAQPTMPAKKLMSHIMAVYFDKRSRKCSLFILASSFEQQYFAMQGM
jgi:hypothetical protein